MPVFKLHCPKCGAKKSKFSKNSSTPEFICQCGEKMIRAVKPPTGRILVVTDNGMLFRKVENEVDIKELLHERSQKDQRKRD
jgi:type I restriction-modification system DNA methylase subunit